MLEVGIPLTDDFHSAVLDGGKFCEITINPTTNLRDSSQTSYLASAKGDPDLAVFTNSMAERIVFDNLTATGVVVNGSTIGANKEVIISAGTFQSPQILMLSGVGPADHLRQHNITVLLDRPGIGQDMADHIFFGPSYKVILETYAQTSRVQAAISLFTANQTGPLQNNNADYIAFERLTPVVLSTLTPSTQRALSLYPSDWPELEYFAISGFFGNFSNSLTPPPNNSNYATILAGLVKPTSRGTVTLASRDFCDLPLINPNWLTTKADQDVAVAAYKRVRQIFATDAMRPILGDPGVEAFLGLKVARTDEEILEVIRNTLATIWHAAGTQRARVGWTRRREIRWRWWTGRPGRLGRRGLGWSMRARLRCCRRANPQSTIYALAEKIAQGILDES
jgi:choline dehydrogenase